jgi:hypothetical protein
MYFPAMTIEEIWTWCALKEDREDEENNEAMEAREMGKGMEAKTGMESGEVREVMEGREEREENPKRHRPGQAAARWTSIKESMDKLTKGLITEKELPPRAWMHYTRMKDKGKEWEVQS